MPNVLIFHMLRGRGAPFSRMLTLAAKKREDVGKKVKALRKKGFLPAVLYGPKVKAAPLQVGLKEFEKVYFQAGESSLISLEVHPVRNSEGSSHTSSLRDRQRKISNGAEGKKFQVLIHDVERDPLTDKPIHVDFYQPDLEKEVQAKVPLVFEGDSLAVKELGGTLVHNISEVEVKALPQKLPKEILVQVVSLKTFEDHILVKDLVLQEGVKILKEPDEIVAQVVPPTKVEEELEKPIEEKVEEVEKVEKPAKEKELAEEEPSPGKREGAKAASGKDAKKEAKNA
ncbi:MAG: large subunit ribosomal protein L25 [Parcubacteria group bacterium Gr01-1014_30]|nr:MAG: large subunit ribosomal protein L25 [Parcubacteria group bacterium Gr01-1014_30]